LVALSLIFTFKYGQFHKKNIPFKPLCWNINENCYDVDVATDRTSYQYHSKKLQENSYSSGFFFILLLDQSHLQMFT